MGLESFRRDLGAVKEGQLEAGDLKRELEEQRVTIAGLAASVEGKVAGSVGLGTEPLGLVELVTCALWTVEQQANPQHEQCTCHCAEGKGQAANDGVHQRTDDGERDASECE